MGCWNETCGITQLPICYRDKVRMILIVKSELDTRVNSNVCYHYTTDLWMPFGLPLKGTYDEYGGLENIEKDIASDLLLDTLKNVVLEVPDRMGYSFKISDLDWKTALQFLTDEGLRIKDGPSTDLEGLISNFQMKYPDNNFSSEQSDAADEIKKAAKNSTIQMYHMMVHEDIYQALAKNYKAPEKIFSSMTYGNFRSKLESCVQDLIKEIKETKDNNISEELKHLLKLSRDHKNLLANYFGGSYNTSIHLRKYIDFIEDKVEAGEEDDLKDLINEMIDFACFGRNMSLLRKLWMPQTGKGGQDREYSIHKFLGERIASFSERKIKEDDET